MVISQIWELPKLGRILILLYVQPFVPRTDPPPPQFLLTPSISKNPIDSFYYLFLIRTAEQWTAIG